MSGALAFCLSASGIGVAAAAYLHASSAYLDNATVKLQQLPALWPLYYRVMVSVLTKPRRLQPERTALQQMSITTDPVTDEAKLVKLSLMCGCHPDQDLPLLFPTVMSFRLSMAAMAAPAFPLSVLGGVLSGYRAVQLRAVPAAEPLAFRAQLQPELRTTATGNSEYDITIRASTASGELVWHDRSTFTAMSGNRRHQQNQQQLEAASEDKAEAAQWRTLAEWHLGSDVGRRFAAINGDVNPIHMAAWCAKLFGFRSNIAHGMLLLARFVQAANETGAGRAYPRAIQATLKRPMLLPGHAVCQVRDADAAGAGLRVADWPQRFQHGMEFAISAAAAPPGKHSIIGQLQWGVQQHKL